jgi:hypothetical protein
MAIADDWLEAYHQKEVRADMIIAVAKERIVNASDHDWCFLQEMLGEERRKWFVGAFFQSHPVPKALGHGMLQAGVREQDASFNRWFIEPCVRSFGAKYVLEQLLEYLHKGDNAEKAGAANASYWVHENSPEKEVASVRDAIQEAALREFIANDHLDVRCCLISKLDLQPADVDEQRRSLIEQVLAIARNHPDEYIRHRVAVQLGANVPLMPLQRRGE